MDKDARDGGERRVVLFKCFRVVAKTKRGFREERKFREEIARPIDGRDLAPLQSGVFNCWGRDRVRKVMRDVERDEEVISCVFFL